MHMMLLDLLIKINHETCFIVKLSISKVKDIKKTSKLILPLIKGGETWWRIISVEFQFGLENKIKISFHFGQSK